MGKKKFIVTNQSNKKKKNNNQFILNLSNLHTLLQKFEYKSDNLIQLISFDKKAIPNEKAKLYISRLYDGYQEKKKDLQSLHILSMLLFVGDFCQPCKKQLINLIKQQKMFILQCCHTSVIEKLMVQELKIQQMQLNQLSITINKLVELKSLLRVTKVSNDQEQTNEVKSEIELPIKKLLQIYLLSLKNTQISQDTASVLIKQVVESLHSLLLLISKENCFTKQDNLMNEKIETLNFCYYVLEQSSVHKDILSQICIIFWKLYLIDKQPQGMLSQIFDDNNSLSQDGQFDISDKVLAGVKQSSIKQVSLIKSLFLTKPQLITQLFIPHADGKLTTTIYNTIIKATLSHQRIASIQAFSTLDSIYKQLRQMKFDAEQAKKKEELKDYKQQQITYPCLIQTRLMQLSLNQTLPHILKNAITSDVRAIVHIGQDILQSICLIYLQMTNENKLELLDLINQYCEYGSNILFTALNYILKTRACSINQIIKVRASIVQQIYTAFSDYKLSMTRSALAFIKLFVQETRCSMHTNDWARFWMGSQSQQQQQQLQQQQEESKQQNQQGILTRSQIFHSKILPMMILQDKSSCLDFIQNINQNLKKPNEIEHNIIGNQQDLLSLSQLLCLARKQELIIVTKQQILINKSDFSQHLLNSITHNEDDIRLATLKFIASQIKLTQQVFPIQIKIAYNFITLCLKSSSQKYRQKAFKYIHTFLLRIRIAYFTSISTLQNDQVKQFLRTIYLHLSQSLNICHSLEQIYSSLQILKYLFELFGINKLFIKSLSNDSIQPINLAEQMNWFNQDLFPSLVMLLKNSWQRIRALSSYIIEQFPTNFLAKYGGDYISQYFSSANELIVNARCMVSEGGALMLYVLYRKSLNKCLFDLMRRQFNLEVVDASVNQDDQGTLSRQIMFINIILRKIQQNLSKFQQSLIQGKTQNLIHGYISVIRFIFDQKTIDIKQYSEKYNKKSIIITALIQTMLRISDTLSKMLSNIGVNYNPVLISDNTEEKQSLLKVDCRGHPIVPQQFNESNQDFQNFVVVGIWLALKEAGETLESIINWLSFSEYSHQKKQQPEQQNKQVMIGVIPIEQIIKLSYSLKQQLFNLKHRGALSKAGQSFQKLCTKLIKSTNPILSKLPQKLLIESLEQIKTTDVSKILRRSAGIPPLILSILKAETSNSSSANNPKLLVHTLNFLYTQYESYNNAQQNIDDFKVHTLNIIKVIFQDSSLRHDVSKFVTRGLKLDIIGFSHNNWSIRNSSLMSFTAISRRVLGQNRIQQASIIMQMNVQSKRDRGMTSNQFFLKFPDMIQFVRDVLNQNVVEGGGVVLGQGSKYLVLLLLSRLHPSSAKQDNSEIIRLVEQQFSSSDIFTRQIAAKAVLPFIGREQSLKFATRCFKIIQERIKNSETVSVSSNEVYGYLHQIYLLLIWGVGSKNSQNKVQNLEIIFSQIKVVIKAYLEGELNAPILQISVKILSRVKKFLVQQKLDDELGQIEGKLKQVMGVEGKQQCFDPCIISLVKEIILYFQDFSPDVILTHYIEIMKWKKQAFITLIMDKHEELQYLVQRVIKIIKHSSNKIPIKKEQLQTLALQTFNHTKQILKLNIIPLLDIMLKLIETTFKLSPQININLTKDNINHIQNLINHPNPLLIKRNIKLISVISAKTQQNFKTLHSLLFKKLQKYSYSTSQDFVRVACVKAIRNITQMMMKQYLHADALLLQEESLFKSYFFLLHDQNPALRKLVAYYISSYISQLLSKQQDFKQSQIIDIKSEVIVLKNLIKLLAQIKPQFLLNFIGDKQNLYKEHLQKNYNDKIFFYEPINRYIDVIQVKKEMISELVKLNDEEVKQKINLAVEELKSRQGKKQKAKFMVIDYEEFQSDLLVLK